MSDLQKLTMHREDVAALEDAADTLMRDDYQDRATRLYALALRLRTEAGWTARFTLDGYSVRTPSNVRELRRG